MSVLWERLAGDTNKFAFKISFRTDPNAGSSATDEESLSWGSFQIWAGGQNLCVHNEPSGDIVDSANWYLVPLLEWITRIWDPLFHEERFPVKNAGTDSWTALRNSVQPLLSFEEKQAYDWDAAWHEWWARHNIQASRNGGLFPDVYIRRWRDLIELSWGPTALAGAPENFRFLLQNDYVRLEPLQVAEPLYEVILEAVKYLRNKLPQSLRYKNLLRNIEKIKKGNDEERLAWLACLGKVANDYVRSWKKVRSRFSKKVTGEIEAVFGVDRHDILIGGSCQAALMFGSVSPTLDVKDAINLARNMIRLYSTRGEPAQLQKFTSADPLEADEKIWDQGYNMAEVFLKSVDLPRNSDDWIDVKGLVKRLGIFVDEEFALGDHGIRAVSIAGPQHTPAILININYPPNKSLVGRRFTLAHELFHILHDRTFGKRLAIASGPWAPLDVEKRANAFAAMFLMPPDLVRKAVAQSTEPVDSWSGVLAIAHRLKTSPSATFEHLTNMGLIDESTHDRMHLELESRLEGA